MEEAGADYLAFLEYMDWSELAPGTLVVYTGRLMSEYGIWVVKTQIDDTYYELEKPEGCWERMNADRIYLTPLSTS